MSTSFLGFSDFAPLSSVHKGHVARVRGLKSEVSWPLDVYQIAAAGRMTKREAQSAIAVLIKNREIDVNRSTRPFTYQWRG